MEGQESVEYFWSTTEKSEWPTNEDRFSTGVEILEKKCALVTSAGCIHTPNMDNDSVDRLREGEEQVGEFWQNDEHCGSGKTLCYCVEKADVSGDGAANYQGGRMKKGVWGCLWAVG